MERQPDPNHGSFAFSPLSDNSDLTADQRALAAEAMKRHAAWQPVGEVHLLFYSLAPGQAEVQIKAPAGHSTQDTISAAIRELNSAHDTFGAVEAENANDGPDPESH